MSEIHGMAQRGGSVVTQVRLGQEVYSPVIDEGEADIIIANLKDKVKRFVEIDGLKLAAEAGNAKSTNVVLMGVLARFMDFPQK
ncbi:MAG: 2-oxoacid:acceptor oxidoreductase family protein [Desulfitobacteriaceae bacterium]